MFPGSDPARWPQVEESVKEERRREAMKVVRGQMVECEEKKDAAREKSVRKR